MGLFKSYPDLKGIISPTTVGIAATARPLKDTGLSGKIQLTGLGLPSEMAEYIRDGTCKEMALWNPIDLGYLAMYVTHLEITGELKNQTGEEGRKVRKKTVVDDGNGGKMALLGPPFKFDKSNIDE
jgi:rhamnose transport system substrate-binding protein